jgi:integrase
VDSYADTVRLHITPSLGRKVLRRLTVSDVDQLLAWKRSAGYSATTVRIIRAVLRRALRQAEREGLVSRNAAALSSAPRVRGDEGRALSVDQAKALLDQVRGTRDEPLLTVMLAFGLRRGEALGLRWSALDWGAATLKVTQAVKRVRNRTATSKRRTHLIIGELKTARSRRALFLTPELVELLRRHRARLAEERIAIGPAWREHDLIFPSALGTPLDPDNVSHWFSRICRRAGLGHWHLHELRHSRGVVDAGTGHRSLRSLGSSRTFQRRDHKRRVRASPRMPEACGCRSDVRGAANAQWLPQWLPEPARTRRGR